MSTAATVDEHARSFEEQYLKMLLEQMLRIHVPKLLIACALGAVSFHAASPSMALSWCTLFISIQVIRWFAIRRFVADEALSHTTRIRIATLLTAIESGSFAMALIAYPSLSFSERAIVTNILIGLSAGSITTTSADKRIFLAFVLPMLIPLAVLWLVLPAQPSWSGVVVSALLVVFTEYLFRRSRDMEKLLRESFTTVQERAALIVELRNALRTAELASQAKTRFLASASHDLRQPIQTLSLFSAALSLRPLDDRSRHIAASMNVALQSLTGELNSLLDISKLDAGLVKIEREDFDLSSLLQRTKEVFAAAAAEKNLSLSVSVQENLWVSTDRTHMERVIRNLVENAIKYTEHGSVTVTVSVKDKTCELTIADTGCGIAPEEHTRIFEEFYQIGNEERDRKRGLGLGLSIVKRLTDLLEIPLSLTSTPGIGTRIVLSIPIASGVRRSTSTVQSVAGRAQTKHVMVVDDEAGVREATQVLLEEIGCTVSACSSTEEAIALARNVRPDLLLCDFRLRGTDNGIETVRAVRRLYPRLPALIVSGDSAPQRLLEASAASIPMLHKPVTSAMLIEEIGKLTQ